jgi:hypothetical protein
MRVRELIEALQKCDPELQVAFPARFNGRDDYPTVVATVVTTTERGTSAEMIRCVILNPTFAQADRSEEFQAADKARVALAEETRIKQGERVAIRGGHRG